MERGRIPPDDVLLAPALETPVSHWLAARNAAKMERCDRNEHAYNASLRARQRRSRDAWEQGMRLEEFVRRAESSVPGLSQLVGVFRQTESWEATAKMLGRQRCDRIRRAARQLAMNAV